MSAHEVHFVGGTIEMFYDIKRVDEHMYRGDSDKTSDSCLIPLYSVMYIRDLPE